MCKTIPREPPMSTSIDTITFGCQLASTYLALDFWGSQNRNAFSTLRCQGVSVGSGNFWVFHVFRKKFPRGPGGAFCAFVCFRTSKISGYFRELNKSGVEVYKSPGCFAALRRYPCLRVQSSSVEAERRSGIRSFPRQPATPISQDDRSLNRRCLEHGTDVYYAAQAAL